MTANQSPGRAANDADLVRYLDGELDAQEAARVEAALAADAELAARLDTLRLRAARLRGLLGAVDPSAQATEAADPVHKAGVRSITSATPGRTVASARPSIAPSTGWLRAAAIIGALITAAVLVPPVRAWIVDRLQSLVSDGPAVATSSPENVQPTSDTMSADVPAPGPFFVIDFDNVPVSGSLTIRATGRVDASYEIESQQAGGSALVLPDGVRFQNRTGSTSNYTITVPAAVTTVRLRMDGRMMRTIQMTPGISDVRIDLATLGGTGSG